MEKTRNEVVPNGLQPKVQAKVKLPRTLRLFDETPSGISFKLS